MRVCSAISSNHPPPLPPLFSYLIYKGRKCYHGNTLLGNLLGLAWCPVVARALLSVAIGLCGPVCVCVCVCVFYIYVCVLLCESSRGAVCTFTNHVSAWQKSTLTVECSFSIMAALYVPSMSLFKKNMCSILNWFSWWFDSVGDK